MFGHSPVILPFCCVFCLLAILFYFTIHLLTFLLVICLLSCLRGAKQLLPFVCKVFGFGLPLLFSSEMAEAFFREGLEGFGGVGKYLWLFLN